MAAPPPNFTKGGTDMNKDEKERTHLDEIPPLNYSVKPQSDVVNREVSAPASLDAEPIEAAIYNWHCVLQAQH